MHRERKLAALRLALKDEGWVKGAEAIFYCPKHTHHKRKLAINVENDKFHCWICGWSGMDLSNILRLLGQDNEFYQEYVSERKPKEEMVGKLYEAVRLPREFRTLSVPRRSPYYHQAIGYLSDRGITADDICVYKLGYCEDGPYANRIIIPSFDEYGILNFFVGRSIYQADMKYKHGRFDKDIIFNDLLIDWTKPVTLVEGPFDAIKAGYNAIPLQGTFLKPGSKLFTRILDKKVPVFVALDDDAWESAFKTMSELVKYGIDVSYVKLEGLKDPGEATKERMDELRGKAVHVQSSNLMRMKLMHAALDRHMSGTQV